jgi:hypothetical protein
VPPNAVGTGGIHFSNGCSEGDGAGKVDDRR